MNKKTVKLILRMAVNTAGVILILGGVSLLIWVARPYISLYLLTGEKRALEKKVAQPASKIKGDRIIIPSVLVDAPIIEGFTDDNLSKGVTHVTGSAKPGEPGNIILAGHNYSSYWISNSQNLFSLLHLMANGTKIYVFYEGKKYEFKSTSMRTRPRDDPKTFDTTKDDRLTLVASASSWSVPLVSSVERLIVTAKKSR